MIAKLGKLFGELFTIFINWCDKMGWVEESDDCPYCNPRPNDPGEFRVILRHGGKS